MLILSANYSKVSTDKFTNLAVREGGGSLLSLKYSEEPETIGICGAGSSDGNYNKSSRT